MPSIRIDKETNAALYYLTFTVKDWYYIFDRYNRFVILSESLKYCQENKGLIVYAYVFMLNHIHLIVFSPDVIGFIRDFKKYTSKEIQRNIIVNEPNVLKLFEVTDNKYEFWSKTNMPKQIVSEKYLNQKISYIHNNPVRKGYVSSPEYWQWSSANPESNIICETFTL
jgi:REP element-mobilizing transposase RayT